MAHHHQAQRLFASLGLVALVAAVGSLISCRPEIDCQDLGCAYGYSCDLASGECQRISQGCAVDDDCEEGEVCDSARGVCRPEQRRCTETQPCPSGQSCDGQTGYCEAAPRCTVDGCPSHEVCDAITERCVARPCDDDVVCPLGYVCELGFCAAGCRPGSEAPGCPGGEVCLPRPDTTVGQCQTRCSADEECPPGQRCGEVDGGAQCVAEPPCDDDVDCRSGEVCRANLCVAPPCSDDDDCLDEFVCHLATGNCVGGDCTEDFAGRDDERPPNHTQANAYPLAPNQEYTALRLCAGREDWFSITVRSSNVVRLRADPGLGAADLDLHVYDAAGILLSADETYGRAASVKFTATRTQVVFVRVSTDAIASIDYDLEITTEFCDDDLYEENDSQSEARAVPTAPGLETQLRLSSCGFDEDWFRLPQLDGANGLSLSTVEGPVDLSVSLLTPDGAVFSVGDRLRIARLGASGDYYLHATTRLGQSGAYRIDLSVQPPFACPDAGGHVGPTQARAITADMVVTEVICPLVNAWEVDWFALEVEGEGLLEIVVTPPSAPVLQATLLAEGPEGLAPVRGAAVDDEGRLRLGAQIDPSLDYYLRISTNQATGRLLREPTYEVSYEITASAR